MNTLDAARRAVGAAWGLPWRHVRVRVRWGPCGFDGCRCTVRRLWIGTVATPQHWTVGTQDMSRRECLRFAAEIGRDLVPPT